MRETNIASCIADAQEKITKIPEGDSGVLVTTSIIERSKKECREKF